MVCAPALAHLSQALSECIGTGAYSSLLRRQPRHIIVSTKRTFATSRMANFHLNLRASPSMSQPPCNNPPGHRSSSAATPYGSNAQTHHNLGAHVLQEVSYPGNNEYYRDIFRLLNTPSVSSGCPATRSLDFGSGAMQHTEHRSNAPRC
jgi:hypothetical protein